MVLWIIAVIAGLSNAHAVQKDERYLQAQFSCLKEFCASKDTSSLNSCYFDRDNKQLIFDSMNIGRSYFVANAGGTYLVEVDPWVKRIVIKFPDQKNRLVVERGAGFAGEREVHPLTGPTHGKLPGRIFVLSEKRKYDLVGQGIADSVGVATLSYVRQTSREFMSDLEQHLRANVGQVPMENIIAGVEQKRAQYLDRIETCQKAAAIMNDPQLLHTTDVAAKTINLVRVGENSASQ
jgi:hypothetical protein